MERRKFIKTTIPAAGIMAEVINGLPIRSFAADNSFLNAFMAPYADTDKVLVLVQLQGGNDGLNTVIPISSYSSYFNARTNVAIPEKSILKLSGYSETGLHPSMSGFQQLFNEGMLSIVQDVGYPSPNFSHFRATDIWMSASESNAVEHSGWIGRYLDHEFPGYPDLYPTPQMPDPLAIQVGSVASLTCQGPSVSMGMSITNPNTNFDLVDNLADAQAATPMGYELSYIRQMAKQTSKYSDKIRQAAQSVTIQGAYPADNYLAAQLKIVARLIKGGLKTRVYMVGLGGFDTHSLQVAGSDTTKGNHANLLNAVSSAIKAFSDDLKGLGIEDRVIGMTFSEFGRRIKSNGSGGTDHGAAAPLFLFGKNVISGITGNNPYIAANVSVAENIPFQYDFRSVYASVLSQWFCVQPDALQQIMLKNFQLLPLINGPCNSGSVPLPPPGATSDPVLISNFPNPFTSSTTINFSTEGGNTIIQIIDSSGKLHRTLVNTDFPEPGNHSVSFNSDGLSTGVYYARLQNKAKQQVRPMLKVR